MQYITYDTGNVLHLTRQPVAEIYNGNNTGRCLQRHALIAVYRYLWNHLLVFSCLARYASNCSELLSR